MASGVFGAPISEETVRATGEYKEPITQKDVADYAMKMMNAVVRMLTRKSTSTTSRKGVHRDP
ncbi:unnamed protein product [Urochloa humidicola]